MPKKRAFTIVLLVIACLIIYCIVSLLLDDREPFLRPSSKSSHAKTHGTFMNAVRIEPTALDCNGALIQIKEGWVEKKKATYTDRHYLLCFTIDDRHSIFSGADAPSFMLASDNSYFASLNKQIFYINLVSIDRVKYPVYLVSSEGEKKPVFLTIEKQ